MIQVIPMKISHMYALKRSDNLFADANIDMTGDALLHAGVAFTIIDGDKILGCGGVVKKWNGVGELWIAVSAELKSHPIFLLRHTRKVIEMIRASGFHRLDMHIEAGNDQLQRWAEALGFTFEGTMLKYGPDQKDHHLYAIT